MPRKQAEPEKKEIPAVETAKDEGVKEEAKKEDKA